MRNICVTCGTRYSNEVALPEICSICADDRQYIGEKGQLWTNEKELIKNSAIRIGKIDTQIYDLRIIPQFAIGQKAHLIVSPSGNILWDCIPMLDEATTAFVNTKGGIQAIAISHPHYYSLMAKWAQVFDCPVYLHGADKDWIQDYSKHLILWEKEQQLLWDNIKLIRVGGHFPGSCVLHLPGPQEKGILLTGDSMYVTPSKVLTFMYSYPNMIPLPEKDILQIYESLKHISFDRIYGAFEGQIIHKEAKDIFIRSIERYLQIFS